MATNVLVLFEYPSVNGGEQSFLATADAVRAAGFELTAAVPPRGALHELLSQRFINCVAWDAHCKPRVEQSNLRDLLSSLIDEFRPDILHSNSLSMARLAGPVASDHQICSIGHVRDIVGLSRQAVDDVNTNDRLLFVSHAAARFHVSNGVSAKKSFVLHNGIKLQNNRVGAAADPVIGFVGQIGMRKGIDVLLDSCHSLFQQRQHIALQIVGRRFSQKNEAVEYERQLIRRSEESPLAGRVHWLGWRNDARDLIGRFTMLVHPARQEPFGRVLLEAAAAGVPVVATDVGGTRELFGRDGALFVPQDDSSALAQAMESVLDNPIEATARAQRAQARVARYFNLDRIARGLLRHYAALV